MRGEYKVPGGKLVAVDVEVDQGKLSSVSTSGDFFMEPDSALELIDMALVGAPEESNVSELTVRIDQGLSAAGKVTMMGFTPQSVAIAVRRALGRATSWHDHTFDFIHEGPQGAFMHMALDEVIAHKVGAGLRQPTLRIWEWAESTVVMGSFQSFANEIDQEGAQRHGVTVARRISGGGAMFIEPGNTITFSLYVPASLVEGLSFEASYAFLDDWVIGALRRLGIEASYVPLNDVTSPGGKIAGSAQKRLANGAVLHHMTMAYDIDADTMMDVLRIGREKLSDKGIKSAKKRVDPLRSQTGLSRTAVVDGMVAYFKERYDVVDSAVTDEERSQAEALVASKFATPEWLARVP